MRHRLLFYSLKELRINKKAFIALVSVMTSSLLIIFNILTVGYGTHLAEIENETNNYHVQLTHLTESEVDSIEQLDYVESVRPVKRWDGIVAYIILKNENPYTLKSECQKIINDLGLDEKIEYKNNVIYQSNGVTDDWINIAYYDLVTISHAKRVFPSLLPFMVIACACICIAIRVRDIRSIHDYGIMRTIGFKKIEIMIIPCIQTVITSIVSFVFSTIISVLLYAVIYLKMGMAEYMGDYSHTGLVFEIPYGEFIGVYLFETIFVIVFQLLHIYLTLRSDITDNIRGVKNIIISFVQNTSKHIYDNDKLKFYRNVYAKRTFRESLIRIFKNVIMYGLSIFMLIMSIIYNQYIELPEERDFFVSSAEGFLTEEIINELSDIPFIENIHYGKQSKDGIFSYIEINAISGEENNASLEIKAICDTHALLFSDTYHMNLRLSSQAKFFTPYFFVQAIFMAVCVLIIIGADLMYELKTREQEFIIIRTMGYPINSLRYLSKFYVLESLLGYVISVAGMFALMNIAVGAWDNDYVIYPLVILSFLGLMIVLVHRCICERYILSLEKAEFSIQLTAH